MSNPSLHALQLFISAARTLNFSKTAAEQSLTPGAVSHQIKKLEQQLGLKLFIRVGNSLQLSQVGSEYAAQLQQAFAKIEQATASAKAIQASCFQFGVNSAFALRRLMPNMQYWHQQQPNLDLRVRMLHCDDDPVKLDLDLIFGRAVTNSGYEFVPLAPERYLVCGRPALIEPLLRATDSLEISRILQKMPRIDLLDIDGWALWQAQNQIELANHLPIQRVSHSLLMIEAVLAGQGVALLDPILIQEELKLGLLKSLPALVLQFPNANWCLSWKLHLRRDQRVQQLQDWLQQLCSPQF